MREIRQPFEINASNAIFTNDKITITIPAEKQNSEGLDLYFSKDFIGNRNIIVTKAIIESKEPIQCFYNWLLSIYGTSDSIEEVDLGKDLTNMISPIMGIFGFSGFTENNTDIIITLQLK